MEKIIHNAVVDAMLSRRSIRAYKPEQITQEELDTLLVCGFNAPSGGNGQQWFLTVIQDPALLGEISAETAKFSLKNPNLPDRMKARYEDLNYSASMGAPTAIFFAYPQDNGEVNVSILSENVVLAAHSLGLGSCYLGGIMQFLNAPEAAQLVKKFQIPEGYKLVYGLSVGYPDQNPDAKPRDLTKYVLL
jgi:nitroreductase